MSEELALEKSTGLISGDGEMEARLIVFCGVESCSMSRKPLSSGARVPSSGEFARGSSARVGTGALLKDGAAPFDMFSILC